MPIQILMPALSPTMTEGTLAKWLKKEGDIVKSGEVIAEIETDKATMEVEAVDEGTIAKILIPAGATGVKVNALIAVLLEEGEDSSAVDDVMKDYHQQKPSAPAAAPIDLAIAAQLPSSAPAAFAAASPPTPVGPVGAVSSSGARIYASPLARRIAEKSGLDLRQIRGTGPRGRIIRVDVEQHAAGGKGQGAFVSHVSGASSGMPAYRVEPVTGMRKVIAQRLTESKQTIPHFYLSIDVEVDDLLKLREEINQAQADVKVSVNDMLVKATALALIQVPEANASWAQTEIRYYETADISVAVAVEGGLVTPVIRQANLKSLCAVSADMKRLAEAARAGKLMPEEWQGGTFTISNLGMFGIQQFEAIINPPQACILAVGTSERKPVVRADGRIEAATIMRVSLSADHRVVDGVVGAKLLSALRALIQRPLGLVL